MGDCRMIDLYYWTTPNGHKITIFLEETGLPYTIKPIDISKGEQFDPTFLAISPNNRIPAIVDQRAGRRRRLRFAMFESARSCSISPTRSDACIPAVQRARLDCIQWLFWQMGNLGPMAGQNHHFRLYAPEKVPYAMTRYLKETGRLYGVLDQAPRRSRIRRRRLFDRRYRVLSLGAAGAPGTGHRRVPASQAMEGNDRRAARCRARLRVGEDCQRQTGRSATSKRGRSFRPGPEHAAPRGRPQGRRLTRTRLRPRASWISAAVIAGREAPSSLRVTRATMRKSSCAERLDHRGSRPRRDKAGRRRARNGLPWLTITALTPFFTDVGEQRTQRVVAIR